jgi:ABC-type uncharacterized transport system auxiliary subunit
MGNSPLYRRKKQDNKSKLMKLTIENLKIYNKSNIVKSPGNNPKSYRGKYSWSDSTPEEYKNIYENKSI